jgi:hypothetical protein
MRTRGCAAFPLRARAVHGVYDSIDAVFYGSDGQLEYDLEVAPHSDPARIALRFDGADTIDLDADGALVVTTGTHTFKQRSPVAYQAGAQGRQHVASSYRVESGRGTIALGAYDPERPLVIDPVIAYATLLGGSSSDVVSAVAADRSGHAFATGYTCSVDFPNTHGTTKVPNVDEEDCDLYVTKVGADGRSFIYSTIIGGSSFDQGGSIAVDSTGAAYVTGTTSSADFPTTAGAVRSSCGDTGSGRCPDDDAFVIKLSPAGSALVYSTYLGGARSDTDHAARELVDGQERHVRAIIASRRASIRRSRGCRCAAMKVAKRAGHEAAAQA